MKPVIIFTSETSERESKKEPNGEGTTRGRKANSGVTSNAVQSKLHVVLSDTLVYPIFGDCAELFLAIFAGGRWVLTATFQAPTGMSVNAEWSGCPSQSRRMADNLESNLHNSTKNSRIFRPLLLPK
jgi:hypothetical protein